MTFALHTGLFFRRKLLETLRQPVWLVTGLTTPLLYLALFAPLLRSLAGGPAFPPGHVLDVFVPGILVLIAFGAGMGAGWPVIWELDNGVIERLRVTPGSRFALLLGTAARDVVMFAVPGVVVIAIAALVGFHAHWGGLAVLLVLLALLTAACSATSCALGLTLKQIGSLAAVVTGVQLPLTLLSGILLPLSLGPSWLRVLGHLNPMYYAVQASRSLAAGSVVTGTVGIGFLVTGAAAALALWWGTRSYQRAMALSLTVLMSSRNIYHHAATVGRSRLVEPYVSRSRRRCDMTSTSQPVIAFLGLGRMGRPMAMNLVRAGFHVRVWNRTLSKTSDFAAVGGVPAAAPADATRGADVVITMLTDGPAVRAAMSGAGPEGGLAGARKGQIWVQMSTVGVEWTERLARDAAARRVSFVDAPVSGSEGPATSGDLVILASGASGASGPEGAGVRDTLAPVFAALGRSTVWLGDAGAGTSAKLVLNNLLVDLVEVTAEALTFAKGLELDPAAVVELLGQTPLGSPFTVQKARAMVAGDFRPAFALKHAVKDARLAVDAARASDTRLALTEALLPSWRSAESSGHADDDLSVVYAAGRS
jgi:3-hydroxyisobutyrate dehydrogenase